MKMILGTIQKAPHGAPGVPNMQHEAPWDGPGTPVARLFHEIDALRGSTWPTPGAGAEPKSSQSHHKNKYGNRCQKNIAKTIQKYNKMPKSLPKTMVNPRDSGTCEALFFVKNITLKIFCLMIKCA